MTAAYTEIDFTAQITSDRTWRLKEISDLKDAAIKADPSLRRVLLRSLTTICYAHWEGYVRFAARKYLEHVALRKLKYVALSPQFTRNYFLPRLAHLSSAKTSMKERCAVVDEILNASEHRFTKLNEDLINTRANLSFDVFTDICLVCGISVEAFDDKSDFINKFLLKRRNSVAHGEDTYIAETDLDDLTNNTISLMRSFGDSLENLVYEKQYKS